MSIRKLDYQASLELQRVISSIGHTEDIKFSDDEKCLAVVDFVVGKVHLFVISIENTRRDELQSIVLSQCITISSDSFKKPHGIFFLGNDHFVVTNRMGDIALFRCPTATIEVSEIKLAPLKIFKGKRYFGRIYSPGSIASYRISDNIYSVIVCNNYKHNIVSFTVELGERIRIRNKGVLIKKGLSKPIGICISPDRKWIAVSNPGTSTVLLYCRTPFLNRFTSPSSTQTGISYPHGIRFSTDGKILFVTNSGGQHLHLFKNSEGSWYDSMVPDKSIKTVADDIFCRAKGVPGEGGTKGIDISHKHQLMVTSAEHQVLNFYSIKEVIDASVTSVERYIAKKDAKRNELLGK